MAVDLVLAGAGLVFVVLGAGTLRDPYFVHRVSPAVKKPPEKTTGAELAEQFAGAFGVLLGLGALAMAFGVW